MKYKVVGSIVGLVLLVVSQGWAQSYAEEALILSRTKPGGTARVQAMGSAQNSLGGDLSSAYYNPAGLGMYNRSDFSISPGYLMTAYDAAYLGTNESQTRNNLFLPNLGAALHVSKDGTKGFWGGTLGISYNRVNNFNETISYSGTNNDNSIVDYFLQQASGRPVTQFDYNGPHYNSVTGLGYYNFLIGPQDLLTPPGPPTEYFTDVSGIPLQHETIKTGGAQNQWNISYGVNFNDRIFVGAGIGFTSVRYTSEKTYTETFDDPLQPLDNMRLVESLTLDGGGINATLGVIMRPIDKLQVGVSAATPTSYDISDTYHASMSTSWRAFPYQPGTPPSEESASTDELFSTYSLVTPWRLTYGMTYFFEKRALVTMDAEWLNYGKAEYSGEEDYSPDNVNISQLYQSTLNLRFGGEYRMGDYRFRGGFGYMPDPLKADTDGVNRSVTTYSIGAGYRKPKFYIDMAVVFQMGNNAYRPYQLGYPLDPIVNLKYTATTVVFTIGFPSSP